MPKKVTPKRGMREHVLKKRGGRHSKSLNNIIIKQLQEHTLGIVELETVFANTLNWIKDDVLKAYDGHKEFTIKEIYLLSKHFKLHPDRLFGDLSFDDSDIHYLNLHNPSE